MLTEGMMGLNVEIDGQITGLPNPRKGFGAVRGGSDAFYILPSPLLRLLQSNPCDLILRGDLRSEIERTTAAEPYGHVAFNRGFGIDFRHLNELPATMDAGHLKSGGIENATHIAALFTQAVQRSHRVLQGYLGWLVQQREFQEDLSKVCKLAEKHAPREFPPQPCTLPLGKGLSREADPADASIFSDAVTLFYAKWRLQSMATWDLPRPFEPQYGDGTLYTLGTPEGSLTPCIPDTFPIDRGGLTSELIELSRIATPSPHLDEWKQLISGSSREKKRIDVFGRQFRLQHFWRVLNQRYQSELRRSRVKLYGVFAEFLTTSIDTIKRDVSTLDDLLDAPLQFAK